MTLFTYPYATLCNYQNTLMHKSELRANLTLIIHVIKVYELRVGTTRTHRSIDSLIIQFWSGLNILLQRINWTPIFYVNSNKTLCAQSLICYLLCLVSPWIGVCSLTKWKISTFQDYFYHPWVTNPPIVCLIDISYLSKSSWPWFLWTHLIEIT